MGHRLPIPSRPSTFYALFPPLSSVPSTKQVHTFTTFHPYQNPGRCVLLFSFYGLAQWGLLIHLNSHKYCITLLGLQWQSTTSTRTHGLKQQKCILSQLWRLEVHNQGISRATPSLRSLEENPSLPLLATGGSWHSLVWGGITTPFSASVFTWPSSLWVSLCLHMASFLVCVCVLSLLL